MRPDTVNPKRVTSWVTRIRMGSSGKNPRLDWAGLPEPGGMWVT